MAIALDAPAPALTVRSRRTARALAWLAPLLCVSVFIALAGYRYDRPGPHYDEALFVSAALRFGQDCTLEAAVDVTVGCVPVLLSPVYVGGLKAIVHAPVFAAFGTSLATLRLPTILVAALAILFGWALLRRSVGAGWAFAGALLLALDPAFVAHARIDYGPVAFSVTLKLALLYALWRWLEQPRARWLALMLACAALGSWDKLTFTWILAAYAVATLAACRARLRANLAAMPRRQLLSGAAAALAIGMLALLVLQLALQDHPAAATGWGERARHVWDLYAVTFGSASVLDWVRNDRGDVSYVPNYVLCAQLAAGLVLLAVTRPAGAAEPVRAQLASFLTVAIGVVLLALVSTPQVGGSHHLMALWPLQTLQAIALAAWAVERARSMAAPLRIGLAFACVVGFAAIALQHARLDARQLAAWRDETRFHALFDPAIERVAHDIAARPPDLVVSTDWGLHNPLLVLLPARFDTRLRDWWPKFTTPPGADPAGTRWLGEHLADREVLFVAHAAGAAEFAATREHLPQYLVAWHGCVLARASIPGSAGAPLFELTTVGFGTRCAGARR